MLSKEERKRLQNAMRYIDMANEITDNLVKSASKTYKDYVTRK